MRFQLSSITSPELYEFAQLAAQYCSEWFGEPNDISWPTVLLAGDSDCCVRNILLKEYMVTIRRDYTYTEQQKAAISHETYHRFTMRRPGLREKLWVDEMLAFVVSQRILRHSGLQNYADMRIFRHQTTGCRFNIQQLKIARVRRVRLGFGGIVYPSMFGAAVACLGTELEYRLSWNTLLYILQCHTWKQWLEAIDENNRQIVKDRLGL